MARQSTAPHGMAAQRSAKQRLNLNWPYKKGSAGHCKALHWRAKQGNASHRSAKQRLNLNRHYETAWHRIALQCTAAHSMAVQSNGGRRS